jgi:hypothetical protein
MPLTSAERSKIYGDKKKDDPAFKGNEQKRQAEIRKELKIGGSKKKRDKVKEQNAKRNKRYRRNKKMYKASLNDNMTPDIAPELPQHSQYSLVVAPRSEQQDVIKFFYQDDISRAAPGMRDFLVVRQPLSHEKQRRGLRYMLMTLYEAYSQFKADFPQLKIAFSTFAKYRKHVCPEVLLTADTPQAACLCIVHENFIKLVFFINC